jgi:putative addiction module component (TIGR02574 family)
LPKRPSFGNIAHDTDERGMSNIIDELFKLSPAERIQLAEDLWDSVAVRPEDLTPLTDTQRVEVERRLAAHNADPSSASSWGDVRARLWSHLG